MAKRSYHADPASLMRIKNLQLRAQVVVEGFLTGLHRSPYHGFSVEFSEYRQYSPGDDLRFLDWRLLARTDRYYVKRFEDETNLRCTLLLDTSSSMQFGSGEVTKADYARTFAATVAQFLTNQRDAVGLLAFDQHLVEYLLPRYRPGHLHRIMTSLERAPAGTGTDLGVPLDQVARTVKKRGLLILISDFLAPLDHLDRQLGTLRARGHELIAVRVLDKSETDFSFEDAALFEDLESKRQLYINPAAAREKYLARFNEHAAAVQNVCDRQGIQYVSLTTDQPLELALFDLLSQRSAGGRRVRRNARQRGAV